MKQYITKEQWNELSEKGKEKLEYWWWKKVEIWGTPSQLRGGEDSTDIHYSEPLLSIGQMFEFLSISKQREDITVWCNINKWYVFRRKDVVAIEGEELCDALWEAVKEVLEK